MTPLEGARHTDIGTIELRLIALIALAQDLGVLAQDITLAPAAGDGAGAEWAADLDVP